MSIARAWHQIDEGNYAAARQYFADAASKAGILSPRQRRKVMDGLCRTEYQIGEPSYPLAEQLSTCSAALKQPDSKSSGIFSEVVGRQRAAVTKTINAALAQGDIASVNNGINRYRSLPGGDPEAVQRWTRQTWTLVGRETQPPPAKAVLASAISRLSHNFPNVHHMSVRQFRHWIESTMTIDGVPIVSKVEVRKSAVALWIEHAQLANAAFNLDRFARVNDGLVARCRCNGRTKVALNESDLPAYLVRLAATDGQSEVLILDQF